MKLNLIFLFLLFVLLHLAACNSAGGSKPTARETDQPHAVITDVKSETRNEKISIDHCADAVPGTYQLIYAAHEVCFLYPDSFDVFQGDDGSLTLYERSLLNTEAPLAALHFEPANGRVLEELVAQYIPGFDPATGRVQTITLGGETALFLDNLPGQDINRHIIAIHNDTVFDLMIARIGSDYGAVGEEAEALFKMITDSFQFIGFEPAAPLLAGPECPEASADLTLYTNAEDGFCMLLPDGYIVDDSLTTETGGRETAVYIDSPQDTSHARMFITVEEANGRSLEAVTTEKQVELEAAMPDTDVLWSFGIMLDGEFANQFDQVPGQDLSRQLLMVHDGRFYTLSFIPDEAAAGAAYIEMELLYETVLDSFSFLWQFNQPYTPTTVMTAPDVDPYQQARQIIEQAAAFAPEGWQVQPCEGEAPVLCINDGPTNVGVAELNLYPLSGYATEHHVRLVAQKLPPTAADYSEDHIEAAQQALHYLAEEYLAVIADDRALTYPDDTFTSLAMEPVRLGALPALVFGFERSSPTGEIMERYLNVAAFDSHFIYWFSINYDPPNVFTFASETAVSQFTPFFYEIAASLMVPLSVSAAESN